MKETSVLVGPLVTGCVMAGVLTILFLAQERFKARRERARYANLIAAELNRINDIIKPPPWTRFDIRTNHPVGALPKNTYDGLVSSAMISIFDANLQRQIHAFYENATAKQYGYLRTNVKLLLNDVYAFRAWNERRRNFFRWWRDGA